MDLSSRSRNLAAEPSVLPTNKVLVMTSALLLGQTFINATNESDVLIWIMDGLNIVLAFIAAYATYDRDNTPGY